MLGTAFYSLTWDNCRCIATENEVGKLVLFARLFFTCDRGPSVTLCNCSWHSCTRITQQKINRRVTRVGIFEVSVRTHVALRMFIMQVLASQLHFLANRNAGLAIPPLFWPVDCIKIGGHVVLVSGPTVYSLYCARMLIGLRVHILMFCPTDFFSN